MPAEWIQKNGSKKMDPKNWIAIQKIGLRSKKMDRIQKIGSNSKIWIQFKNLDPIQKFGSKKLADPKN